MSFMVAGDVVVGWLVGGCRRRRLLWADQGVRRRWWREEEREEWKIVGFILHSARDYERNRHETW